MSLISSIGKMASKNADVVSTSELAELFGIHIARISDLRREGMPCLGYGKFSLRLALRWYVERLKMLVHERQGNTILQERTNLMRAKARRAEIDVRRVSGELLSIKDARDQTLLIGGILRQELLSIPGRLSFKLEGKNSKEIQDILDFEISKALNECASRFDQYINTQIPFNSNQNETLQECSGVGNLQQNIAT